MAVYITHRRMAGGAGHEHIASVRWRDTVNASNTGESTRADMVVWIQTGHKAYVASNPSAVPVGVVEAQPPYLRTYANGVWTDNLLSLPTF